MLGLLVVSLGSLFPLQEPTRGSVETSLRDAVLVWGKGNMVTCVAVPVSLLMQSALASVVQEVLQPNPQCSRNPSVVSYP